MLQLDSVVNKTTFPWQSRKESEKQLFSSLLLSGTCSTKNVTSQCCREWSLSYKCQNFTPDWKRQGGRIIELTKTTGMTSSIMKLRDSNDVITTWFHLLAVLYTMIVRFLSKFSPVVANPSFRSSCINLDHVFPLEPSTTASNMSTWTMKCLCSFPWC